MAFTYQNNKTSMQKLMKDLAMRLGALPTLKAKETALRLEIKKVKRVLEAVERERKDLQESQKDHYSIWMEYPSVLSISDVIIENRNIAGVIVPLLGEIKFEVRDYSLFTNRAWIPGGTEVLKKIVELSIRSRLYARQIEILHQARKKTTQKVNLYEKVQIPLFHDSINRIKRFLEDEENLSRSAQKVIKARREREES